MLRHKNNLHGYILLIMLIYMQVISLLAMQSVSAVIYQRKLMHHRLNNESKRRQVLRALGYADSVKTPQCMIAVTSAISILKRDFSWWQQYGCSFIIDENQYFFVREPLGFDDCALITNSYNQSVMPVYYRNTLLYHSAVSRNEDVMVQDTIAVAGEMPPSCHDRPKLIKRGRHMLRWL